MRVEPATRWVIRDTTPRRERAAPLSRAVRCRRCGIWRDQCCDTRSPLVEDTGAPDDGAAKAEGAGAGVVLLALAGGFFLLEHQSTARRRKRS